MSARLRSVFAKVRLPLGVFATGAVLSLALAYLAHDEIESSAQVRFDADAAVVARDVEDRFDAYTEVLIGLRALFNTSDAVSRSEFRQYVLGLNLKANFPGFEVLNYAPYVPAAQRSAFEESVRRDTSVDPNGYPNFAISPPGLRAQFYPLLYLEPMEGREKLLGRDVGATPVHQLAVERARDSGLLTSSGNLIKIKGKDAALAMRLPVYQAGMPTDTVEQRRAAYIGSVGAGFHVANMMRGVLKDGTGPTTRLRLFDGGLSAGNRTISADRSGSTAAAKETVVPDTLLFDSKTGRQLPNVVDANTIKRTLAFDLGGRNWLVEVSADRAQVSSPLDRYVPWLILFGGLAISTLLAGIIFSLTTSRGRAVGIATSMTRDLRTSERRLQEAQQLASLGSWILDSESGMLHCSEEAARILGFDAVDAPSTVAALMARVPKEERAAIEQSIAAAALSGERSELEHRVCLPDGAERWVHVIVQLTEEDGKTALRGTVRDDTQRKKSALRLKLEHDIARLLASDEDRDLVVSRALEAICTQLHWDCAARWAVSNDSMAHCGPIWTVGEDPALEEFARISRTASYGRNEGSLGRAWASSGAIWIDTSTTECDSREAMAAQAGLAVGVVMPMASGLSPNALEFFHRKPRVADAEMLESLLVVSLQIGQYEQRKQAEHSLRYFASHDALTGLSNRVLLQQQLSRAIKRSNRHQKRLAVLFVDLDRFKHVNDTLGHGVGDVMIRACAARLKATLREGDEVARFGGDEFVLLLEDLGAPSDAIVVVDKVLACCAAPFVIDGHELHVSASVGVSVYPEDGTDGETLLKNADIAMYRAKDKGRGTYEFFAAQMNAQGAERFMLESGLRRALERNELMLHYQPKMSLRTQKITGVEALMRWNHPVLGMISPARFIPIAEETGLIEAMGKWALQTACADARAWQHRGLPPIQMSVNLSARQLNSPTLFTDIARILEETGLDPQLLELEITESAMMQNPDRAVALLRQIRAMGVLLAIDDFGTGYSSLSYLQRFPLSTVKIDRSFVKDLGNDGDAAALTTAIIGLAHGLRMKVVAEGVETPAQLAYLRSHDCDEIQGYLLSKPAPGGEVYEFMARHLRKLFAPAMAA